MNQREVDRDAPANDHLGDRVELVDPYPLTKAAWRAAQQTLPDDVHADPAEVAGDMAGYAAAPHKTGTQVRAVTPSSWFPAGRQLATGRNAFLLVDEDPQRTRATVWNHATDGIYLAPTPTEAIGVGALYIPGFDPLTGIVHHREIRSWARIYLFTPSLFAPGNEPVHVQVVTERWG